MDGFHSNSEIGGAVGVNNYAKGGKTQATKTKRKKNG